MKAGKILIEINQKKDKKLDALIKKVSRMIDPVIEEVLNSGASIDTKNLAGYQIRSGGKRIRPMLSILSCLVCGGKIKDALYPSAGLEILHNYSLVIDDLIDNSEFRRNKQTLWIKFGRAIAECISVNYAAAAFKAANHSKNANKISEAFIKMIKTLVDGEVLDILFEAKKRQGEIYLIQNKYKKVTLEDYFNMIGKKTAIFTQTCCEVGGICANGAKQQIKHLERIGFCLGMAGQIKDDILDIFGQEEKIGKKIGKDIIQGKRGNIVLLLALKELSKKDRTIFCRIFQKNKIANKDLKTAINLIKKTNSYQKSIEIGRDFVQRAKNELAFLPNNKWNSVFQEMADFIVERDR